MNWSVRMEDKPSIQALIDKAFEPDKERVRSGKYSPSSLGKCYRAQFWNRKNEPQSNPPDQRTRRIFKCGDLFHDFVQNTIIAGNSEVAKEVPVENGGFKGRADLVIGDEVIDIKSQHSKSFWYRRNLDWNKLKTKLYCNILQVVFYAVQLEKPKARLVFVSKDDLVIQEYPIEVSKWVLELAQEIKNLTEIWEKQELPPALPRAYPNEKGGFSECGYCSWLDLCNRIEENCD